MVSNTQVVLTQCYQTRDYSGRSFVKVCQVPPPDTEHRPSDPFINGGHCRRSTLAPTVTNSCENCSPARFEGWRGLGLQSRLIAGVSPIAAIAAAPPVGFPRLVQYSGAMAPIPVYGGQGQCQPAGPHILLCTAHIIQPLLLHHFRLCQTLHCWARLSDVTHVRTIGNRRLRSLFFRG